jgi:hypothetical protein
VVKSSPQWERTISPAVRLQPVQRSGAMRAVSRQTFAAPKGRDGALKPLARYRIVVSRLYFRADAGFANPEV